MFSLSVLNQVLKWADIWYLNMLWVLTKFSGQLVWGPALFWTLPWLWPWFDFGQKWTEWVWQNRSLILREWIEKTNGDSRTDLYFVSSWVGPLCQFMHAVCIFACTSVYLLFFFPPVSSIIYNFTGYFSLYSIRTKISVCVYTIVHNEMCNIYADKGKTNATLTFDTHVREVNENFYDFI